MQSFTIAISMAAPFVLAESGPFKPTPTTDQKCIFWIISHCRTQLNVLIISLENFTCCQRSKVGSKNLRIMKETRFAPIVELCLSSCCGYSGSWHTSGPPQAGATSSHAPCNVLHPNEMTNDCTQLDIIQRQSSWSLGHRNVAAQPANGKPDMKHVDGAV